MGAEHGVNCGSILQNQDAIYSAGKIRWLYSIYIYIYIIFLVVCNDLITHLISKYVKYLISKWNIKIRNQLKLC